jgi:hypothetical protein
MLLSVNFTIVAVNWKVQAKMKSPDTEIFGQPGPFLAAFLAPDWR